MKKIIIAVIFAIPFFIGNSVFAQNGIQNFEADVTVTSQYTCPSSGDMTGYIPILGITNTLYNGTGDYTLVWTGNFLGYQPCTVEVTTNENSQGQYCHGIKTKDVSQSNNDITVQLDLIAQGGGGGNEQ